ncbi:hypothetical protein PFISCL1PPCAC_6478, partial [Pristionchus fissidentatus]
VMNNYTYPLHYLQETERSPIDIAIRQIELRAADAKGTIEELLYLLDMQSKAPWPEMLDKMSSLGAVMAQLQSMLHKTQMQGRDDPVQHLKTHLIVPQMLSMDVDPRLQAETQGRVHSFHHDLVPDYLRTKSDTEHEKEEQSMETERISRDTNQVMKQIMGLNRHVELLVAGHMNADKTQMDSGSDSVPTFDVNETARLAKAICSGFGLERTRAPPPPPLQTGSGGGGGGMPGMAGGGGPAGVGPGPMGMGMGGGMQNMQQQQPGMMHGQPHPQQMQQQQGYGMQQPQQNGMGGGGGGHMGGGPVAGVAGGPHQLGGHHQMQQQPGMMMGMNPMIRRGPM